MAWLSLVVALMGAVLIPILVLVVQTARRSGGIEQQLSDLVRSETDQNERINRLFDGLDRRVRWVEERVWGRDPRYPRR